MMRMDDAYMIDGEEGKKVVKKRKPKQDLSGAVFENWIIVSPISIRKDIYIVKCCCGREFKRYIRGIVSGRSSACFICYRKSKVFNRLRVRIEKLEG